MSRVLNEAISKHWVHIPCIKRVCTSCQHIPICLYNLICAVSWQWTVSNSCLRMCIFPVYSSVPLLFNSNLSLCFVSVSFEGQKEYFEDVIFVSWLTGWPSYYFQQIKSCRKNTTQCGYSATRAYYDWAYFAVAFLFSTARESTMTLSKIKFALDIVMDLFWLISTKIHIYCEIKFYQHNNHVSV